MQIQIKDFYADWCRPCTAMKPIIEELESEFPDVSFEKIDIDANAKISGDHNVMGIPTLIVFKNGKETKRFTGVTSKGDISKELSGLLA